MVTRASGRVRVVGAVGVAALGLAVVSVAPAVPASARVPVPGTRAPAGAASPTRVPDRLSAAPRAASPRPATRREAARRSAASAGAWSVVAPNVGDSSSPTPQIVRFGGVEVVAWGVQGTNTQSVASRRITFAGAPAGPVATVVGPWASVSLGPALVSLGGRPLVVFGGYRSLDGTTPADRATLHAARTADGRRWTLVAGALSRTSSLPGTFGLAATTAGGRPVTAFTTDSSGRIGWHVGIDPVGSSTPDHLTPALPSCCVSRPSVAQDTRTKQVWTAFYEDGETAAANGYFAARLLPTPGRPAKQPASSVGATSVIPKQRVPLVARVGGGLWTAYRVGYPSPTHIRLRDVETGRTLTVAAGTDVKEVGLAAAPGGRLWVYWDHDEATVQAVRTNAAVTGVGPVRTVATPGGAANTTNYQLDGEGSTGPLTLVVDSRDDRQPADRILATRIDPGLAVSPGRRRLAPGQRFGVVVTDAGIGIRGATVHLGAQHAVTDAHGIAFLRVPAGHGPGRVTVTATLGGYAGAAAVVTIT